MISKNVIAGIAGAAAGVAVVLALAQWRAARVAAGEVLEAGHEQQALQSQLRAWENKLRIANRRAAEAERDTAELLKAIASVRREKEKLVAPTQPVQAGLGPPGEDPRDAQERRYHQELAKKRAEEAKAQAAFEESVRGVDPATAFDRAMARAAELAAKAQFQAAIRTFNAAMAAKPADLTVPEKVWQLQALLQAQNSPVDVPVISDGETFVSIQNTRAPAKFVRTTMKLLPGDYEVVGRRRGYRDVHMLLQVRNGVPPPVVSVMCTRTAN